MKFQFVKDHKSHGKLLQIESYNQIKCTVAVANTNCEDKFSAKTCHANGESRNRTKHAECELNHGCNCCHDTSSMAAVVIVGLSYIHKYRSKSVRQKTFTEYNDGILREMNRS